MKRKLLTILCFSVLSTSVFSQTSGYAKVVEVNPAYQNIQVGEDCQYVQVQTNSSSNSGVGTVIGGVAGGIIGNQVGRGNGKVAATALGAVVGALSGQHIQNSTSYPQYSTQRQCIPRFENRIVAYNFAAEYNGNYVYGHSQRPINVGDQVRVSVNIQLTNN